MSLVCVTMVTQAEMLVARQEVPTSCQNKGRVGYLDLWLVLAGRGPVGRSQLSRTPEPPEGRNQQPDSTWFTRTSSSTSCCPEDKSFFFKLKLTCFFYLRTNIFLTVECEYFLLFSEDIVGKNSVLRSDVFSRNEENDPDGSVIKTMNNFDLFERWKISGFTFSRLIKELLVWNRL